MPHRHSFLMRCGDYLRSLFLSGFFTLLPIAITLWLFTFTFKLLKTWLEPLHHFSPLFLQRIPHSEFFLVLLFILVVGTVLRIFLLRSVIHAIDDLISNIPLVRPVYTGIKQLVSAFSAQDKITFKKVVFVEFPREGIYSVGFLTSEIPQQLSPNIQKRFYSIFVPTTPNPTTGYYIVATDEDYVIVDLTTQEAMALVMSGGIVQPERFRGDKN